MVAAVDHFGPKPVEGQVLLCGEVGAEHACELRPVESRDRPLRASPLELTGPGIHVFFYRVSRSRSYAGRTVGHDARFI